jgi:phage minor structural protein
MYVVTLENSKIPTEIHGNDQKLTSAKIVRGINAIDSFTFTMTPKNSGFYKVKDFTTLVKVYNTVQERYEFLGRVLYSDTTMNESGLITKEVTCENLFGYLCDSVQPYVDTRNWTVNGLLRTLIDEHNKLVEPDKRFTIGTVTVTDANDNVYCGIQRENTWDAIQNKLVKTLGGEVQLRVENGVNYIDYLTHVGETKQTEIAVSKNMKSIKQEKDPSAYVTRLIPLGCKLTEKKTSIDEDGNEVVEEVQSEKRLDITAVNAGRNYIDDEQAVLVYGVHVGVATWDDVTDPNNLMSKGEAWLAANNKVAVKYSITALDLSLIGLDIDDFNIGNTHPIKNSLIGVDDTARIIKKTIDICNPVSSTIEVGDSLKTLSDIQRDQANQISAATHTTAQLENNQMSAKNDLASINKKVEKLSGDVGGMEESFSSQITQLANSISLDINGSLGSKASITLSAGGNSKSYEMDLSQVRAAFANDKTAVSISAGTITFNTGTLVINSTNFKLSSNGKVTANDALVYGDIITIDGSFKTEMDKGNIRLYYSDVLCGTINTKYWTGAATEGISLRIEEGGNYIMFSHADDTQGSGYKVDYYLNAGWSSNYDEMHIFQTSARFLSDVYLDGKTDVGSLRLRGANGKRYLVQGNDDGTVTCSVL